MIAALAAGQGIGRPAEEALKQFLPEQDLKPAHATGSILSQGLSHRRGRAGAARDKVVQLLVKGH